MKKNDMIIRKGTEKDLSAFFELYWISSLDHTHYTGKLDTLKPKEQCKGYIIHRQRKLLKAVNYFFYVAEENNKIIGMITGHVGDRDEAKVYAIERMGFIDELCVDPEHRKSGVGKALLDALLNELYTKDVEFVGVGAAYKNPAIEFYKSCRFTPEGMWLVQEKQ